MLSIEEFCDKHEAWSEHRDWALANCTTMTEVWDKASGEFLMWVATQEGVLTEKELRLMAAYAARSVQHLHSYASATAAIEVVERYANGEATDDELISAQDAARAEADSRINSVENSAAWVAIEAADLWLMWESLWDGVSDIVQGEIPYHSPCKMSEHEQEAALKAAEEGVATWLRANTTPCFE